LRGSYKRLLLVVTLLLVTVSSLGGEAPGWARREYAAPIDLVFTAALKSLQEQHHEVKSTNDATHTVDFHVGTSPWSWGYNIRLTVTPIDRTRSQVVVGSSRSGGKAVSWGSGKKEVLNIFAGIDAEFSFQNPD